MKPTRIIEICANSAQSCVEAEAGGAKRVEPVSYTHLILHDR